VLHRWIIWWWLEVAVVGVIQAVVAVLGVLEQELH
jgi:hypothetical protein